MKFGIDPTAADVHIGHAVPMIVASRFQRMGHRVVFIVGDVTGKIGDPSGRVADRPALTDDDIRANMATYRRQVSPFFDFDRAEFRYNSEWLAPFPLPRFLDVLGAAPAVDVAAARRLPRAPRRRDRAVHGGARLLGGHGARLGRDRRRRRDRRARPAAQHADVPAGHGERRSATRARRRDRADRGHRRLRREDEQEQGQLRRAGVPAAGGVRPADVGARPAAARIPAGAHRAARPGDRPAAAGPSDGREGAPGHRPDRHGPRRRRPPRRPARRSRRGSPAGASRRRPAFPSSTAPPTRT